MRAVQHDPPFREAIRAGEAGYPLDALLEHLAAGHPEWREAVRVGHACGRAIVAGRLALESARECESCHERTFKCPTCAAVVANTDGDGEQFHQGRCYSVECTMHRTQPERGRPVDEECFADRTRYR